MMRGTPYVIIDTMKKYRLFLIVSVVTFSCSNVYYISPDGNDNHSGKSQAKA
jgi:hypothetical protein